MLRSRVITIQADDIVITVVVNKGCPQGGVLPPLLWCLVIDELIADLNDRQYQTEGFSDDIATVIRENT